jgi:hypothetical protein
MTTCAYHKCKVRNIVLQRHIVYKTMFYYCFRLHNSWYRYAIRFHTYYMFRPDVAIFRYIRSHNHLFLFPLLSLNWPVFTLWECSICLVLCNSICFKTY